MWKYLKGVPPPKKRKADDEGVSDTKAKMKKYDSSARMTTFQLSIINYIHLISRPWLRHNKATSKMYCDVCIIIRSDHQELCKEDFFS